jgi:eukaryotic-like serine/threonine-protein kinase
LAVALMQRRPAEAAALLRQARRQHPADFWLHFDLGNSLLSNPSHPDPATLDEAAGGFWAAIALRPDNVVAHNNLGNVLRDKGNLDSAAVCIRKAIELDPKFADAHCSLGNVLWDKGDQDGAVACIRKAIELDPKLADAHNNLGVVLQNKGDLDGAAACYKKAIELDPKYAVAHTNLGLVLRDQGKLDEAIAECREAVRLDPHFAGASANLAEAKQMAAMQDKLPALQKGEFKPRTSDELRAMAGLCKIKKLFLASARMYADAFADDPKLADDLKKGNRYDAACWAALAAAGQGKDDPPPDETKKADLRRQALAWLRADLDLHAKQLDGDKPEDRKMAVERLRHWRVDADLSGLRDAAGLAKLPADEQEACKKLWADVQALLEKADQKK